MTDEEEDDEEEEEQGQGHVRTISWVAAGPLA